jgi:hypothetical protein
MVINLILDIGKEFNITGVTTYARKLHMYEAHPHVYVAKIKIK